MENAIIHWSALEYDHKEKSVDWFWAIGLSAIAGAVIAILYKNYFFGVFLILAGVCMGMFGARKPQMVEVGIFEEGVIVGDRKYEWAKLHGWNIVGVGESQQLVLHTERPMAPVMTVPMPFQDAQKVQEILNAHLEQNDQLHNKGIERLMDKIGY